LRRAGRHDRGSGTWSFPELLTAVSLAPTAALMLLGVPISVAGLDLPGLATILHGGLPGYRSVRLGYPMAEPSRWSLLLLIPLLAALLAAAWHTVARPVARWRPSFEGTGALRICGLTMLAAVLAATAQRITISYGSGGTGTGPVTVSIGASLPAALVAGLAWGTMLVLGLRIAPTVAMLAPRLLLALPGRVDPSWAAVLVGLEPRPPGVYARTRAGAGAQVGAGAAHT
jgi:hypothetical protein